MAGIRSPGLAGHALAVGLHSDPRCLGYHLAPATFFILEGVSLPSSRAASSEARLPDNAADTLT
jgi:hypothetical protein